MRMTNVLTGSSSHFWSKFHFLKSFATPAFMSVHTNTTYTHAYIGYCCSFIKMQHFQEETMKFYRGDSTHLLAVVCFPVVLIALFFWFFFFSRSVCCWCCWFFSLLLFERQNDRLGVLSWLEKWNETEVFTLFRAVEQVGRWVVGNLVWSVFTFSYIFFFWIHSIEWFKSAYVCMFIFIKNGTQHINVF